MIIVLSVCIIALICGAIWVIGEIRKDYWFGWGCATIFIGSVAVVLLLVIPINQMAIKAEIREFEATYDSLTWVRENPNVSPFEIAAIQQKVIEANRWLAQAKYWAENPMTSWFYPPSIHQVQPIK